MWLWKWFCSLGSKEPEKNEVVFWQPRVKGKQKPISGVEICTRLCGFDACQCGGTIRGLYCVWSYYRDK